MKQAETETDKQEKIYGKGSQKIKNRPAFLRDGWTL